MLSMLEYDKACIFYGKSAYSSFLGILFCLKPDRLLAEIVCDILFVFEIHSITKLTLDLLSQMLKLWRLVIDVGC